MSDPTDGTSSTRETWALAINYITGRKRAERALGFLAETSHLLAASLDYRGALGRVAGLTLGYLADFCSIDLLDEGGALAQVGLGVAAGGVLAGALLVGMTSGAVSAAGGALVVAYSALMLGVCLLACVVPTRRALRVPPTEALRAHG